MKQVARTGFEDAGHTVVAFSNPIVTAEDCSGAAVLYEAGDKQIQLCVVVVIKPDSAGGPVWRCHAGLISHICKSAIAVVVIENIPSVVCNVKILPTVAVIITRGSSHAEASHLAAADSGFFSYIYKSTIMIVAIKRVFDWRFWTKKIGWTTIHQVDIHPAIVIKIKEETPTATGFGQMPELRVTIVVHPGNLRVRGWYYNENWFARDLRGCVLLCGGE